VPITEDAVLFLLLDDVLSVSVDPAGHGRVLAQDGTRSHPARSSAAGRARYLSDAVPTQRRERNMARTIECTNHSDIGRISFAHVAGFLMNHATLEHVMHWCKHQRPPREFASIVAQDEYTHDIVLELRECVFAVYDTT
jgi:hypothetical protein